MRLSADCNGVASITRPAGVTTSVATESAALNDNPQDVIAWQQTTEEDLHGVS